MDGQQLKENINNNIMNNKNSYLEIPHNEIMDEHEYMKHLQQATYNENNSTSFIIILTI